MYCPGPSTNVTGSLIDTFYSDRTKRIRDAKAEAQKEIEEYRKQKEDEFKKFEAEVFMALQWLLDLGVARNHCSRNELTLSCLL